jgi:hypothetical protein
MSKISEAGKLLGMIKSNKKARSSRMNGKLGGRPKKPFPEQGITKAG